MLMTAATVVRVLLGDLFYVFWMFYLTCDHSFSDTDIIARFRVPQLRVVVLVVLGHRDQDAEGVKRKGEEEYVSHRLEGLEERDKVHRRAGQKGIFVKFELRRRQ